MLNRPVIILVSLCPVDGYPPVQYQAKLLAKWGFDVVLLTCPLVGAADVEFEHPNVLVLQFILASKRRTRRAIAKVQFFLSLLKCRYQYRQRLIAEIAYDPEGVFFSEMCPGHSHLRIAHLHETLIDPTNRFYEKKACIFLPRFDSIVVADKRRGKLLKSQLGLENTLFVIPNYPMLVDVQPVPEAVSNEFRVVYAGALGMNQALDSVIRSIPHWKPKAKLHLVGNKNSKGALELADLANECGVSERVTFEGRMPLPDVEIFLRKSHLGISFYRLTNDVFRFSAGASNKRYQYMQAGLVQISGKSPDVSELIEQNGIGKCVLPDDLEAIAQVVNYYIEHEDERIAAGKKAFELTRKYYHYELPFQFLVDQIIHDYENYSGSSLQVTMPSESNIK